MSEIKIYLFGKFRIEANKVIHKPETHKAEELLVYLLLHQDAPHTRERLADILWGEISSEQSKSYLRKALWHLQSMLEPIGGKDMLLVEAEWIQLNLRFECWIDIAVLEEAFMSTQGIRGKDLNNNQFQLIQGIVELYRDGLLEGWYQDWCLFERERLQYLYLAMLDKLMDYYEAHGEYENGLSFGKKILHHDRAREHIHRQLMRLHYLADDRTAALRQYQLCEAALRKELDVAPAEATRMLYEMIRSDKLQSPDQSNQIDKNNVTAVEEEPLRAVLSHMSAFQKTLIQLQTQLAQDLRIIQKTIKTKRS